MPQAANDPFVIGSPMNWVEGMEKAITLRISGATSILAESVTMWKETDDVSADTLSGTATSNDIDTITSPTIHSLQGGEIYFLNFQGVVNGKVEVWLLEIRVLHPWGARR